MNNIPVNYFDPATIGMGILGTGLLRPRPDAVYDYGESLNKVGKPTYSNDYILRWSLFFRRV